MIELLSQTMDYKRITSCEIKHKWELKNFSLIQDTGLMSQRFFIPEENKHKWFILLYPRGYRKMGDHLAIYIHYRTNDKCNLIVSCRFNLLDKNGVMFESVPVNDLRLKPNTEGGCETVIQRDRLLARLIDDVLIVHCVIRWKTETFNINTKCLPYYPSEELSPSRLVYNDIHDFLNMNILHDVIIVAQCGTKIPAHKFILMARSPVFAAMFQYNTKESLESRVHIKDVDAETIRAMLVFMETNKVFGSHLDMEKLLIAADKYGIEGLKNMCELELCEKLNIETAAKYLVLADHYHCSFLKALTLDYIDLNMTEVEKTEGMKHLREYQPKFVAEVLKTLKPPREK